MTGEKPEVHEALAVYAPETTETERVPEGYKLTEVGVIPEDWEVATLGEIGKFKNGINKGKEDFGHGFPFVNLLDVFGIPKISDNHQLGLVNSSAPERELYNLLEGDVIFVRSSVKPAGVSLTTLVQENLQDTVFSGFLIRFRADDRLDQRFKEHCFIETGFRNRLIASSTVSANTNINQRALKLLLMPYPPNKQEQRAIAAALSDVDALISALDELSSKKRAVKTAAMQQLLTGKQRLPEFSGEWEVRRVCEFGQVVTGGTPSTQIVKYWAGDFPWVTPTDIDNTKDVYVTGRQITEIGFGVIRALPADSVLVTCIASIGKNAVLRRPGGCNQQINAVIPNYTSNTDFLYYLFEHSKQFLLGNAGITATNIISKKVFSELQFLVPSVEEQTAIAAVLSDMDAEIEALEARREKTRQVKRGMMQELLTGRTRLV